MTSCSPNDSLYQMNEMARLDLLMITDRNSPANKRTATCIFIYVFTRVVCRRTRGERYRSRVHTCHR